MFSLTLRSLSTFISTSSDTDAQSEPSSNPCRPSSSINFSFASDSDQNAEISGTIHMLVITCIHSFCCHFSKPDFQSCKVFTIQFQHGYITPTVNSSDSPSSSSSKWMVNVPELNLYESCHFLHGGSVCLVWEQRRLLNKATFWYLMQCINLIFQSWGEKSFSSNSDIGENFIPI